MTPKLLLEWGGLKVCVGGISEIGKTERETGFARETRVLHWTCLIWDAD
jgi:hypothetical protein